MGAERSMKGHGKGCRGAWSGMEGVQRGNRGAQRIWHIFYENKIYIKVVKFLFTVPIMVPSKNGDKVGVGDDRSIQRKIICLILCLLSLIFYH